MGLLLVAWHDHEAEHCVRVVLGVPEKSPERKLVRAKQRGDVNLHMSVFLQRLAQRILRNKWMLECRSRAECRRKEGRHARGCAEGVELCRVGCVRLVMRGILVRCAGLGVLVGKTKTGSARHRGYPHNQAIP
jgi:hypothetical protein